MEVVATWHGDDGRRRIEQILSTNRTIAVSSALDALVGCGKGYGYAHITILSYVSGMTP